MDESVPGKASLNSREKMGNRARSDGDRFAGGENLSDQGKPPFLSVSVARRRPPVECSPRSALPLFRHVSRPCGRLREVQRVWQSIQPPPATLWPATPFAETPDLGLAYLLQLFYIAVFAFAAFTSMNRSASRTSDQSNRSISALRSRAKRETIAAILLAGNGERPENDPIRSSRD